jgi:hypothetical protein
MTSQLAVLQRMPSNRGCEKLGPSMATREKKLYRWATIGAVRGVRSIEWSCSCFDSVAEVDRRRSARRFHR